MDGATGPEGPQGPAGADGVDGDTGDTGVVISESEPASTDVLWLDSDAVAEVPVPVGGTAGQVLAKSSSTDYDTEWTDTYTPTEIDNLLDDKANLADPTFTGTVSGITKSMVGLGNVDNTSDANKPVSSATQTALNAKASINANWSMSNATSVTVNTGTPTTIASCSITTNGRPVLIIGTGDANPGAVGDWNYITIYRGESQIGKLIINQTSGASHNNPFGVTTIDSPAAGTYTYSLRAYTGAGSITYGEIGNVQAPTIIAMELF